MIQLLIGYFVFLLLYSLMSFFALYQLWHFGYVGDASQKVILLYILFSAIVAVGGFVAFFIVIR